MKKNFLTLGKQLKTISWINNGDTNRIMNLTYEKMAAEAANALSFDITGNNMKAIMLAAPHWRTLLRHPLVGSVQMTRIAGPSGKRITIPAQIMREADLGSRGRGWIISDRGGQFGLCVIWDKDRFLGEAIPLTTEKILALECCISGCNGKVVDAFEHCSQKYYCMLHHPHNDKL